MKCPAGPAVYLAPEEAGRFLAHLDEPMDFIGALLYGTGLRLSEVLDLVYDDVDPVARCIHVRTRHPRCGVFYDDVLDEPMREALFEAGPGCVLFPSRRKGRYGKTITGTAVWRAFRVARERSGIAGSVDSLRGSCVVNLLRLGVERRYIKQILGIQPGTHIGLIGRYGALVGRQDRNEAQKETRIAG